MNQIIITGDGSKTLYNETIGEHYHSKHGALQESEHVFIDAGLKKAISEFPNQQIKILEVGFGTGLNFLLTLKHSTVHDVAIHYTGIEAFPISKTELLSTEYHQYVPSGIWDALTSNYEKALKQPVVIFSGQTLAIAHTTLQEFSMEEQVDLIYFDAFSVRHQPELWSDGMIAHTCNFLRSGGLFVTYAITGNLKRALVKAGLKIEKLPGAPGKREMLRATKMV